MRTYTQGEKYEIKRVMEKVFEVLETTDNDISFKVGFLGVDLFAYDGPMTSDPQEYVIFDSTAYSKPFTELDANRMIAELNVLSHFNRVEKETDTTEDQ